MRFTTLTFLVFFIAIYIIYWLTPARRRMPLLIVASVAFYAAWSVGFAIHFVVMVLINYYFIKRLFEKPDKRILWTVLGIDLANLFLFKYFYLFLRMLFDITGIEILQRDVFNEWMLDKTGVYGILLPLAISFYTFQLMAFAIDVYRRRIEEKTPLMEFMVFILFFPQLVAGPIMRHSDFFHQLRNLQPDRDKTLAGMFLLMLGIIKKVIIADNVSPVIQPVFFNPSAFDWETNLAAAAGFSVRVYCDFSGYTDIARGLGNLLGLELPRNFMAPYLATSFRDLWNRWHITLSTWIRDYLYIPLGGSRNAEWRNNFNLVLSFTLAGLWHGAAYQFLMWGAMHGVALAVERQLRNWRGSIAPPLESLRESSKPRALWLGIWDSGPGVWARRIYMVIFMYALWLFTAIPFNAPGVPETLAMWKAIFTGQGGERGGGNDYILRMTVLTFIFNWLQLKKGGWNVSVRWQYIWAAVLAFVVVILLGRFSPQGVDFIYFQF